MATTNPDQKVSLGATPLDDYYPAEPVFTPLVMDERDRLNAIFQDPAFRKAWRNLRAMKPSVFLANPSVLSGPSGLLMASNRLHEIRGWDMFIAALLSQGKEPVTKIRAPLEEYPDTGTIEAEMQRTGGAGKPRSVPGQKPVSGFPTPPSVKPKKP